MPTILIDGKEYEVDEGRNVLQAALDHKLDLPYFCWHPAMGSVGACRLCAIKHYRDDQDDQGRLVMGCMTPATDGTRVAIDEPAAAQFRRSVVEWLMINHPHDCPVCDEGGECHLQDMTVMTGHAHRRHRGRKRTYVNQYLGPLIHHEMNRCIQCYRCVRFYCDHSGGDDLGVFASRNRVYFGRVEDGILESPFAGNLVEVCPTGVFTDKTLRRHYTRKWDLQQAPSLCAHCSLGCNTLMGSRYGEVRRVTSRYNGEVNGYWLCDRGRFGYEHLNAEDRLRTPQSRPEGGPPQTQPGTPAPQLDHGEIDLDPARIRADAGEAIARARAEGTLAAVGSPRASLETNFALRSLVGSERFCAGIAEPERRLAHRYAEAARAGRFQAPSLRQAERSDVVLVVGTDPTNEAPLLDLALFRARESAGARIHVTGLRAGRLEDFAASFDCSGISDATARVSEIATGVRSGTATDPLVAALRDAENPLVVTGTQHRDAHLLDAVLDLVDALHAERGSPVWFAIALAETNTMGAALLDGGQGPSVAATVAAIEAGDVSVLVVTENDLLARFDDTDRLIAALGRLDALVVLDHLMTSTAASATHALPVAAVAESTGTLVNNEGRMQRFFQVLRPVHDAPPTWETVRHVAEGVADASVSSWRRIDDVTAALEDALPIFAGAGAVAPPAGFRRAHQKIPRMSHRHSGHNAAIARNDIEHRPVPSSAGELPVVRQRSEDPETPFTFSMEGFGGHAPAALMSHVWSPGWNSNEAINQFQIEVGGPLHGGDPGIRIFDAQPEPITEAEAGSAAHQSTDPTLSANHQSVDPPLSPAHQSIDPDLSPAHGGPSQAAVLVCATAEIFGSEETARRAPALAELTPACYLRMHPDRAADLGVAAGEHRCVQLEGGALRRRLHVEVLCDPAMPQGVVTIPAGYPETRWWQEPVWMTLTVDGEPT